MIDLNLYQDREQSYIKHLFLTKYLQAAAFKTLQSRSRIFNFVDAFAGPWKTSDEAKYSDASFDQAINTLEAVRATLGKNGHSGIKIRFCFCEKRLDSFQKLQEYANQNKKFEIYVFHGSFEDRLEEISEVLPDGFTFTFIDPTGWNIRNTAIFEFLRARKGEFLLNFMSDHINRHVEYSKVVESFGHFLADPNWEAEFALTNPNISNEERVLELLKRKMLGVGVAKYLPDFSIMVPRKDRIKMRLILGTHSPHGLELFRDTQYKVERAEIELRSNLLTDVTAHPSLFSDEYRAEIEQHNEGVGSKKYLAKAKKSIVEKLQFSGANTARTFEISLMDGMPIKAAQIRSLLLDLRKEGVLNFELPTGRRVPQPETIIELIG